MGQPHEWTSTDSDGDAHRWSCVPFPAEEGFAIMVELGDLMAGPVAAVAGSASSVGELMDTDVDGEMITRAITGLVTKLGKGNALALARRLLRYTVRDDRKFAFSPTDQGDTFYGFNATFARNYGELRNALTEVARYNFASFFDGFGPGPDAS